MKCKSSTYVVRHYLTTLKYNNISQVCPYKDLGSAKDYIIILLFLMQPSAGDKPDRMQSQEKHNPIYYAQVKTDYESTWQMQLQVPTGAHLIRDSNQARSKQSEDNQLYLLTLLVLVLKKPKIIQIVAQENIIYSLKQLHKKK